MRISSTSVTATHQHDPSVVRTGNHQLLRSDRDRKLLSVLLSWMICGGANRARSSVS
jgi:hypothetical protein